MRSFHFNIILVAAVALAFIAGLVAPSLIYAVAELPEIEPVSAVEESTRLQPCRRPANADELSWSESLEMFTLSCLNRSL